MFGGDPVQFDLFCASSLPEWLPDETCYSLGSRFHRLSGHNTSKTTCKILFGHPRRGYQHDISAGLDHLSGVARGVLGTPESIAHDHSIVPYYLAFASAQVREEVLERMAGHQIGALKYTLGLLTNGLRANHPLKGCRKCEEVDLQSHGVSYWHRVHQLPTVLVCPIHYLPLWADHTKSDGLARFEWLLPDEIPEARRVDLLNSPDDAAVRRYLSLAQLSDHLAGFGKHSALEVGQVRHAMTLALERNGFITPKRSLRRKSAAAAYLVTQGELGRVATLRGLPVDGVTAERQLARLLRPDAGFAHPARYLAVIGWLWESWGDFCESYQAEHESVDTRETRPNTDTTLEDLACKVADGVRAGATISAVAAELGISVTKAQRLASQQNLPVRRRPKKLTENARRKAESLARTGQSKRDIAASLGLSTQTITRLLNTEPGLKRLWLASRRAWTLEQYRKAWRAAVGDMPGGTTKAVRGLAPSAYAWLYRHDRDWLQQSTGLLPQANTGPARTVDWTRRDSQLAAEIEYHFLGGPSRALPAYPVTLGDLCALVPELRAKLRRLDRMPRSAQLVRQLTSG